MSCIRPGLAIVLTLVGIALLIGAIATMHWEDTVVDRAALAGLVDTDPTVALHIHTNPLFFTRYRGLFRTCYDIGDNSSLQTTLDARGAMDDCLEDEGITNFSSGNNMYDIRNHLVRASIGGFLLALLLVVIGLLVEITGQCGANIKKIRNAAVLVLLAAAVVIVSMGIFTAVQRLEHSQVKYGEFPAQWRSQDIYENLEENTTIELSYSFFMGWASPAAFLLAALLFWTYASSHRDDTATANWVERQNSTHREYVGRPSFYDATSVTKLDKKRNRRVLSSSHQQSSRDEGFYIFLGLCWRRQERGIQ